MDIIQGTVFNVLVNNFELLLTQNESNSLLNGELDLIFEFVGTAFPPEAVLNYGIRRTDGFVIVQNTILPELDLIFETNYTVPAVAVPPGEYYLFAVLSVDAIADCNVSGDIVTVSEIPMVAPFAQTYTRRLVKNAELTWFEGDQNTNISDERTKLLKAMIENFDLSDFYTKEEADSLLLAKLNKSLQKGKIFFGDANNLPSEIYPDGLTGFVTVGVGGQYLTIQEAVTAGKYNMQQVGDVVESSFAVQGSTQIIITGNVNYLITISGSIDLNTNTSYFPLFFRTSNIIFANSAADSIINGGTRLVSFERSNISFANTARLTSNTTLNAAFEKCVLLLNNRTHVLKNMQDCTLNGGGTSTLIYTNKIVRCVFNNTFSTSQGALGIGEYAEDIKVTSAVSVRLYDGGVNYDNVHLNKCTFANSEIHANNGTYKHKISRCTGIKLSASYNGFLTFDNCVFIAPTTVRNTTTLISCTTAGLTLSGTKNNVQGGEHTTITVNGNNNNVTGVTQATSISLGAVTGCYIVGNTPTNPIVDVLGNTIY